jgi:hypothetical protein
MGRAPSSLLIAFWINFAGTVAGQFWRQSYIFSGMQRIWTFLGLAILNLTFTRGAALFSEDFENGLSKKWEPVNFEGKTDYTIKKEGTNSVLQARAQSSASGVGTKVNIAAKKGTTFSWRWKIDKTPPGASDDTKKTFDHTARIFIAFKTMIGPPRTINYVWANKVEAGKSFEHPSSGRARFLAIESGDAKAGQWQSYKRDLLADWKLLFGNDDPPAIVGIGLMTDSDGTKQTVTAEYDDLVVE